MCGEEEVGWDMLMCEGTEILGKEFWNFDTEASIRRSVRYKYKDKRCNVGIYMSKYKDKWKETARKHESEIEGKGKIVAVLNELSTTPRRRMGEWMYRSTFSWPRH
jgi:hypothetical protein